MKTVDACGISCPEPVLRLKNALKIEKEILLLLDSKHALENCERFAKAQGLFVSTTTEGGIFKVHITSAK